MVKQSESNDYFKNTKRIIDDVKESIRKNNCLDGFIDFVNQDILDRNEWTLWFSIRLKNPSREFHTEKDKELYFLRKNRMTKVEYAKKSFKYFFSHLNEEFQTFYEKYIHALVFYENNGYDRGIHIHALTDRIDPQFLDLIQQKCNEEFGDTLIREIHPGIARYLAKKYIRETLADFDLYRINSRRRRTQSMSELIWFWSRGFYKVYIDKYELKEKISKWKEAKLHCHYYYPKGKKGWDFIIPSKYYNRVAKELGLPLKSKNGNRVKSGQKAHKVQNHPCQPKVKSSNLSPERRKDTDPNQSMPKGENSNVSSLEKVRS